MTVVRGKDSIVVGCLHFGSSIDAKSSDQIIKDAYNNGISSFDVAELYGHGSAQKILGTSIKPFRNQVKVWCSFGLSKRLVDGGSFGVTLRKLDSKEVESSIYKSLKSLQTEYIDVFNIHAPDDSTPYEETFEALRMAQKEGVIRNVSLSNFNPNQLQKVMLAQSETGLKIDIFQIHGNILEQSIINDFIEPIQKQDAKLYCYRPLARGVLAREYSLNAPRPRGSRAEVSGRLDKYFTTNTFEVIQEIRNIAADHNMTSAQLAIYWLLKVRKLDGVIVGVKDVNQLFDCISVSEMPVNEQIDDQLRKLLSDPRVERVVGSFPDTYFET